jgi:hypothetical protein
VPGAVKESRVVLDYWAPAAPRVVGNPHPVWRADFKVAYAAEGQQYESWTYSGIRGETKRFVEIRAKQELATPGFSCLVKYNPKQPEVSVADCE